MMLAIFLVACGAPPEYTVQNNLPSYTVQNKLDVAAAPKVKAPCCECGIGCKCPPGVCPSGCAELKGFSPAPPGFHWEKYPNGQWGHVQDGVKLPKEVKPAPALPFVPSRSTTTTVPTLHVPTVGGTVLYGGTTPTVRTLTSVLPAVRSVPTDGCLDGT
jgi:hypothetical protein